MAEKSYILQWLIKAHRDLEAAKKLAEDRENILTDIVCYHCQQAAEKFLKAFLIEKGIDFYRTHDLDYLLELCVKEDPIFENLRDITDLTEYAVEVRYGERFIIPQLDETIESMRKTERLKDFVLKALNISEEELKKKAKNKLQE